MKKIIIIILALSLYGCTTYTTTSKGTQIHENLVTDIKTGETTREWILDLFGTPTKQSRSNGIEKFIYTYEEKTVPQYLGSIPDEKSAITTKDELEIIIKEGVVYSYRYKSRVE